MQWAGKNPIAKLVQVQKKTGVQLDILRMDRLCILLCKLLMMLHIRCPACKRLCLLLDAGKTMHCARGSAALGLCKLQTGHAAFMPLAQSNAAGNAHATFAGVHLVGASTSAMGHLGGPSD